MARIEESVEIRRPADKVFAYTTACGSITNEQHNTYEPIEGGTKFTIVYNMKVGGLMLLFSPMIVCSTRKALKKALGNLKGILEAQT